MNHTELKRLAESWRDYKINNLSNTAEHIGMLFVHKRNFEQAVSPDAVLSMIAEIDKLRTQNQALVEALQAAEKLEHEALVALSEATYELKVGNTYTTATDTYKANNDLIHRLDKILNSQYRDRKRAAPTAAKRAQPESAPLSEAQVTVLPDSYYASDFGPDELIRKVEQLHGIKQGGQQ